jgi:cytoskeletal protein RodZ
MTQWDPNITLGQYLRKEREKRGLTIEQVASATKIGVRQLHFLESDQYSELPAKPFIRGFVTSYSRFVGLDHKEVLTHFNSFIDSKVTERPNREAGHSGYAFEKREGNDQSRMILGIVMGSFIVLGGIAMVVLKPSLHRHHHSHVDKLKAAHPAALPSGAPSALAVLPGPMKSTSATVIVKASPTTGPSLAALPSAVPLAKPSPKVAVNASPSPKPTATKVAAVPTPTATSTPSPSPTSAFDPLNSGLGLKPSETKQRLVIKATDNVWVRYRVDDKTVMQFLLRKDKVLVLRGREDVILQLGDPSKALISYNGVGYRVASSLKNVPRQNDATFFFPAQLADKTAVPFPGTKPLTSRAVPISQPSHPAPAPT